MTTPAFDGRDYNGKVIARIGRYVATRRKGESFCTVRMDTIASPSSLVARVVGVAHSDAAARRMVEDMAGGR